MKSNYKRLGDYITELNLRNVDDNVELLLGVSIKKIFIPSIANTIGTDMRSYKIVRKNQFAYGPVTSRNGDKISVALLEDYEKAIVSQAYVTFEISDISLLLPQYLMMWFMRSEFDRYARFISHGSAREIFDWEDMCNVYLPIPSIEKQKEIVAEYNLVQKRIDLNNQLIQKLEDTAQTIYKHWFVDFEFPDENGNPYKSNGGKMVFNEGLEKEIPEGWQVSKISKLYKFQYGKGNNNPNNGGEYPVYGSNGIIGFYSEFNSENAPVIGHIGANCGSLVYAYGKHYVTYNGVICAIKNNLYKCFGYRTLQFLDLKHETRGSSQPFISYDILDNLIFSRPIDKLLLLYNKIDNPLFEYHSKLGRVFLNLIKLQALLLSRLATVED